MQPASMLSAGPVQAIRPNISRTNSLQIGDGAGLSRRVDQHPPSQLLHRESLFDKSGPTQSKMDEILEQMLSLPSLPETSGNRWPWDFNTRGLAVVPTTGSGSDLLGSQKRFTMSSSPSAVASQSGNRGPSSGTREIQDDIRHTKADGNAHNCFENQLMATAFQHEKGIEEVFSVCDSTRALIYTDSRSHGLLHGSEEHNSLRRMSDGTAGIGARALRINTANSLAGSPSFSQVLAIVAASSQGSSVLARSPVGSSGSECSGNLIQLQDRKSPSPVTRAWHPSYVDGILPPPVVNEQNKEENIVPQEGRVNDGQFVNKRPPDDDGVRAGSQDNAFKFGAKIDQAQTRRAAIQQPLQPAGQGISVVAYGSHIGHAQPHGASGVVAGTTRPRVRARRGQATDPHSIAERLRRERIAERMKALQELVPNSNKADKASMLDDIIEYVKFLQLQVKVLSMSRLGGGGTVAPLIADLPSEIHNNVRSPSLSQSAGGSSSPQDLIAAAEHQVAKLMDENMGSAMQYLQGKGLCLMPISLATTISTINRTLHSNNQGAVNFVNTAGEWSHEDALTSPRMVSSDNNVAC